jgi:hypothetical protein
MKVPGLAPDCKRVFLGQTLGSGHRTAAKPAEATHVACAAADPPVVLSPPRRGGARSARGAHLLRRDDAEGNQDGDQEQFLHRVTLPAGSPVASPPEVSGRLVGPTAFKAAGTGDPRPAGSIPVHLRHTEGGTPPSGPPAGQTASRSLAPVSLLG